MIVPRKTAMHTSVCIYSKINCGCEQTHSLCRNVNVLILIILQLYKKLTLAGRRVLGDSLYIL
jgi:hypothetical protein